MLIDSHVNLHAPQFDADREAVISRALASGVRLMVNICDRVSNYEAVRLVEEGVATPEDVDRAFRAGMGFRWSARGGEGRIRSRSPTCGYRSRNPPYRRRH